MQEEDAEQAEGDADALPRQQQVFVEQDANQGQQDGATVMLTVSEAMLIFQPER